MNTIHLDARDVPAQLRGNYSGKKFQARVCESMTIPADAGLWSGGSRDTFHAIRLSDGAQVAMVEHNMAPWDMGRREVPVSLRPGFAIVNHSMFCGKDMGLRFYVHPIDAAALLPAPSNALSELEQMVVNATAGYKASYGGRDRYQMATDSLRWKNGAIVPTRAAWDEAKASLIDKGLLNKAGAITVAGRNAVNANL